MTEQELYDRISEIKSLADAERVLYEQSAGRMSRSDCKRFVSRLGHLSKSERSDEKSARTLIWQAATGFFPAMLSKK